MPSRRLEHEINERFSRLYSLTPDAIKIVEVKENGYFLAFPGERDQPWRRASSFRHMRS